MVLNVQTTSQPSIPPPEQVDPNVNPFPSLLFNIIPLLRLCLVKASKLVTKWIRRRIKGRLRRNKISKGATKQPFIPMQLILRKLQSP